MAVVEAHMKNGDYLNKEWEDLKFNMHLGIFTDRLTVVNNGGYVLGDIYLTIISIFRYVR